MKSKIILSKVSGCSDDKIQIALYVILVFFIIIIIIFAVFYPRSRYNINIENMTIGGDDDPEIVFSSTIPTIAFFYGSQCKLCQSMIPEYERLREKYKDNPKHRVVIINCDKNKDFCSKVGIKKSPIIRYYNNPSNNEYKTIYE